MREGDAVEVREILYSTPEGPFYKWLAGFVFGGYRTYQAVGTLAVVKQVKEGMFQGLEFNYNTMDLRPA